MPAPGPFTNFPNGITSFGIPVVPGGAPNAMARDASVYFLDPRIGSNNNSGKSPSQALATATQANSLMVSESGDVCYFVATDGGTDSSSRDTATIAWSNSGCALIGTSAPVHVSQRARISPSTTFAGPLLTVSGHNNVFANLQFFQGHNAASTCVSVTGQRNYFYNCHFAGIGHATAGDDAASETLLLDGGSENLFENCVIGLDTINRSVACAEIRCDNAATRNRFKNCMIVGFADNSAALFVDIPGSGDIDRYLAFENCTFFNAIDSTATVMTVGMNIDASAGGTVILKDCMLYGATDWANSFVNLAQLGIPSDGTSHPASMGLAVNGS